MSALPDELAGLLARVAEADAARRRAWPALVAPRPGHQPVQTLYVPAERIAEDTAPVAGAEASALLDRHAPGPAVFARVMGLDGDRAAAVRARVAAKLADAPVEDLRCDFEDGYAGADRDADARAAGAALARAWRDGALPASWGVRITPLGDGLAEGSVALLDTVLAAVVAEAHRLPGGFVVTLPKVQAVAEVELAAAALAWLERRHGLPAGSLRLEVQVETTQALVDAEGRLALRRCVDAAAGRLSGAHFGVYDYTAALGLPPAEQRLDHPACDAARRLMQLCLAGTGVWLSDGATNLVPAERSDGALAAVWRRHAADVRHSLRSGFPQGWDLHPAHLVSRYAAVHGELLGDLDAVCARLRRAASHPVDAGDEQGGVLDEPATLRALRARLHRAVACGAVSSAEAAERSGLSTEELAGPAPRPS